MSTQQSPQTSSTDITEILKTLKEVYASLSKLDNLVSDDNTESVLPDFVLKRLREGDIVLDVNVTAYNSAGECLLQVTGLNQLPRILAKDMLPEAPMLFEQTFVSQVVRPVLNAFAGIINKTVEAQNTKQQHALPMLDDESGGYSRPNPVFISSPGEP